MAGKTRGRRGGGRRQIWPVAEEKAARGGAGCGGRPVRRGKEDGAGRRAASGIRPLPPPLPRGRGATVPEGEEPERGGGGEEAGAVDGGGATAGQREGGGATYGRGRIRSPSGGRGGGGVSREEALLAAADLGGGAEDAGTGAGAKEATGERQRRMGGDQCSDCGTKMNG
ncbi:hypothetical protein BS78_03G375400 [Paspalum vaginatum]|nr:hypothetical protein BS78_03G375400 [Paspalum vaginatum]